jgi:hypothetical protein
MKTCGILFALIAHELVLLSSTSTCQEVDASPEWVAWTGVSFLAMGLAIVIVNICGMIIFYC